MVSLVRALHAGLSHVPLCGSLYPIGPLYYSAVYDQSHSLAMPVSSFM